MYVAATQSDCREAEQKYLSVVTLKDVREYEAVYCFTSNPTTLDLVRGLDPKGIDIVWVPGWTQGVYAEEVHEAIERERLRMELLR